MAIVKWRGDAPGVAQVDVQTIAGTPAAGSYFQATCNGKSLRYTIPASVVSGFTQDLIDGFIAKWATNASAQNGIGEFMEVAVTQYDTSKLAFTSLVPGVPFTFTYSAGGGASQSNDATNSVASSGPNDASVLANYSTGALPTTTVDELWFQDCENMPQFGLTALAAIALTKVVFQGTNGPCGRDRFQTIGRTTYLEYRNQYLQLKMNSGSAPLLIDCTTPLLKLDTQTFQTLMLVSDTGTASTIALYWIGTHASNAITVDKGRVAIAYYPGEVATVLTLAMGYVSEPDSDAQVTYGVGTTMGTVSKTGGTLNAATGLTTLTQRAGTSRFDDGSITTATIYAGKFVYAGNDTITTLAIWPGAEAWFNESNQARTITNTTIYPGSTWQDPGATCVHSNAIASPGGGPTFITGTFGTGRSSAISFTT